MIFSESVVSRNVLSAKYTEAAWFYLLVPIDPQGWIYN